MLLHALSDYYTIKVNTKMIEVFGIQTATYWAMLIDIMPRVVNKKYEELTSTGYFTVERCRIVEKIGMTVEEQLTCDQGLMRAGVVAIHPEDPNKLSIDCARALEIILEDDAKVLKDIRKKAKTKKTDETAAKIAGKVATFSAFAATLTHVPEVQEAYRLWVTALVEGKRCAFSKTTIQLFHETMTAYTNNPALQVEILRSAAASGYTNAEWVINSLSKRPTTISATTHIGVTQKQFAGVSNETF